ncbi:very short patch repair endonuclease [Rhodoplanes sp. SY1]|uniref:very short patch repair endonuclease n=1 Tax=Rhodoplanes sp. SY1 TaxID=3166646 RepID=UPI0038B6A387
MDKLTPEARSRNMSRIRSRDTSPEIAVRQFLHGRGLRFRLHRGDLPGKPDLVFSGRRACVFVHGCFWHACPDCIDGTRRVKSNTGYWSAKVAGNRERDQRHIAALKEAGWHVFVVWECKVKDLSYLSHVAAKLQSLPLARQPRSTRPHHPGTRPKRNRS